MARKYKFNWKGSSPKNVPANIRQAFIDPEKNLLPKGLLNNSVRSSKKTLKANARILDPKRSSYASTTRNKRRKN